MAIDEAFQTSVCWFRCVQLLALFSSSVWCTLGFSDFSGQSAVRSRAPVCGGRAHLSHSGQSLCCLHTFSQAEANAIMSLRSQLCQQGPEWLLAFTKVLDLEEFFFSVRHHLRTYTSRLLPSILNKKLVSTLQNSGYFI